MNELMTEILDVSALPGIEGQVVPEPGPHLPLELVEVDSNPTNRTNDLESDYSAVRKNMHFQQQMLMNAATIFLETAKNADSPRHMEVFAALMGQMTTTNKEILKLHKEMKDITSETIKAGKAQDSQGINITNAQVFLGGPTDLMEQVGDAFETKTKNIVQAD